MSKVLMLATTAAIIEQFNKNNILILEKMRYEVHVAGNFLEGNPQKNDWRNSNNGCLNTMESGFICHLPENLRI